VNLDDITMPIAEGPEKSVLSSILKNEAMLARAQADGLTTDHFGAPARSRLFRLICERVAAGKDIELVGFFSHLQTAGELDACGGPGAIGELFTYAPNDAHFDDHLGILREFLARRLHIKGAVEILESAESSDPADLAKTLSLTLEGTTKALRHDSGILTAKQAVAKLEAQMLAAANNGDMPGLSTGLAPIDQATGGMRPGELWVIAAEPSGGKSVAMLQASASALSEGKRVLIVSLEMDGGTVVARMASCSRRIPFSTFVNPRKAGAKWLGAAKHALQAMTTEPLAIHDKGGLNFEQIKGIAQAEADRHGKIDLLIVDYLQLVEGSRRRRDETREQEVAGVSRGLKALAKSLGCPVFTASQLNDQGRMRESRAIGQDADVVLVVEADGIRGSKVRNGERGQLFPLVLNGELQRFEQQGPTAQQATFYDDES
jgi:replicative DNA helicase